MEKKRIHFILPSGGIRGAFQAGFIYCLRKKYSDYFEISRIDGSSVGALNGLALLFKDPEQIRTSWLSLTSISDLFNPWHMTEVINKIKTIYNTYYNKSICDNNGLREFIKKHMTEVDTTVIDKYNCVVVNILNGRAEYINGTRSCLEEYVLASASPWILAPCVKIDGVSYTDGGLLATYPIDHVKETDADIHVIVGYDPIHQSRIGMPGKNILTYLSRLIDIIRQNHTNISKLDKKINKYGVLTVENTMRCPFNQLKPELVEQGFIDGILAGQKFAKDYLL